MNSPPRSTAMSVLAARATGARAMRARRAATAATRSRRGREESAIVLEFFLDLSLSSCEFWSCSCFVLFFNVDSFFFFAGSERRVSVGWPIALCPSLSQVQKKGGGITSWPFSRSLTVEKEEAGSEKKKKKRTSSLPFLSSCSAPFCSLISFKE